MKEIINNIIKESFSQAAAALTQMTHKDMTITHSEIVFITGEELIRQIEPKAEDNYFASIIKTTSILNVNIIFITPELEGFRLYDLIWENPENTTLEITDDVIATIGELTNIIGSSFTNNLANLIHKRIITTTPCNIFDMLGAIMQGVILMPELINEQIIIANTVIKAVSKEFEAQLFILANKDELFTFMQQFQKETYGI